jgi:NAD(P)-dependent dehydrogenase (short-subunit alcohol dehydrogenase family)
VAQIKGENGRAQAFAADVSKSKDCERIISHAAEKLGGVDILINNVGVVDGDADGLTLAEEVWDRIMTINLKAVWLTSRACLPLMRKAGGGVIINISSIAAMNLGPSMTYGMSKTGVNMLTTRMAKENAPYNIRINAIMPGSVETPMFYDPMAATGMTQEEYRAQRIKGVPLGRVGTGWDIANAALFLASDEANYITGVILPVDGGMLTR